MIKAIFFDLDGTLLNSKKQIQPESIATIKKCKEKGIIFFICTARSPMLDKMLGFDKETLSLFEGGVYCNGAVIKSNKINTYKYISADVVKTTVEQVNSYADVHIALHLTDDHHSFNHYLPDEMLGPWGLERDEILPLDENAFSSTAKMIIYYEYLVGANQLLPEQLYKDIVDASSNNANIYLQDNGKTIQLAAKNISKLSAIKEVAKYYDISDEEIAVFGDDINDIEMLSRFQNSVAMGNAIPEVKEIATYVTHNNDSDGISYALEHILKVL